MSVCAGSSPSESSGGLFGSFREDSAVTADAGAKPLKKEKQGRKYNVDSGLSCTGSNEKRTERQLQLQTNVSIVSRRVGILWDREYSQSTLQSVSFDGGLKLSHWISFRAHFRIDVMASCRP